MIHDATELEGRGIATVVLGTHEFRPLALAEARAKGLASLGIVTVPHPIGGVAEELVARKAAAAVEQVQAALIGTVAVGSAGGGRAEAAAARHAAPDDLLDFQAFLMERGWGDG